MYKYYGLVTSIGDIFTMSNSFVGISSGGAKEGSPKIFGYPRARCPPRIRAKYVFARRTVIACDHSRRRRDLVNVTAVREDRDYRVLTTTRFLYSAVKCRLEARIARN